MTKSEYITFASNHDLPVFSQPWFLDSVSGSNGWDVISIKKNEDILLTATYSVIKKFGFKFMIPIVFAQVSGPIIHPYKFDIYNRIDNNEYNLLMQEYIDIIDSLKFSKIDIKMDYIYYSWLPFYWNNYAQSSRYTYIIEQHLKLEEIYSHLNKNLKYIIKNKSSQIKIIDDDNYDKMYSLIQMSYKRKNVSFLYDYNCMNNLFIESKKNQQGKILLAYDDLGNLCSGIFIIWDRNQLYLVGSGTNPQFSKNDSNATLIWEAIKISREKGLNFNFEGSMIKGVNFYFKKFSPFIISYNILSRTNSRLLKCLYGLKSIIK